MNWPAIQEAIRLTVAAAVGVNEAQVQWENTDRAGGWNTSPWVDLVLRSPQSVGVDEARRKYNQNTDLVTTTIEGPRKFRVTVKIWSENQTPGAESVGQLAGNLRTRIRRVGNLEALRAVNVSLEGLDPTVDADVNKDGRMVSLSTTDVVLWTSETETDPTAPTDYIQRVKGDGTFQGVTTTLDVTT